MSIFENLENLNVSEECFDSIITKIEESLQQEVAKKYPKDIEKNTKAAKLSIDAKQEVLDKMSGEKNLYHPSTYDDIRTTKNEKGQQKADAHKGKDELNIIKWKRSVMDPKHAIAKAIKRHNSKQVVKESLVEEIMGIVEALLNEDVYKAIQKYKTKQDKDALMNKAYDNKEKELYTTAKREQKPEEVKILKYADGSGRTLDDGIHKTMNRIRERRNPENKQAQNIMNKGVAKSRAGYALKDEMKDKNSGTQYANKEKEKLANKLIKQGDKEFHQGVDQYQASHVPVNVKYANGERKVELRKKNKYD